jgi:WD repeat-containing protein 24
LKTIRIQGTKCAEETNLRAAIINFASHSAAGAGTGPPTRHRDAFDIRDVKWSHGRYNNFIATAASSGKVILYDLNRASFELARLHEHHRQVHKLAFNPHLGHLLLSASQDGTVRLWDLRQLQRETMTCPSRERYSGLADGIYDIKWSPTDGTEFAFGTDNGVIQRWDYRSPKAPKVKVNAAHKKTVRSIDWHPDGRHLMSASYDQTVKIWDMSADVRRHSPRWSIHTPYPIFHARWRPPTWTSSNDSSAWHSTQIAVSYRDYPVIHVWDFRRPFLPFRELSRYSTAATDMLWHSRDLLWTVGREGMFTQSDIKFAPKTVDRRNLQAFAVSPNGELVGMAQRRPRRGSAADFVSGDRKNKHMSKLTSDSQRASFDDNIDESFLSSSQKRHHRRTTSNRSTRSYASTPPYDSNAKVTFLNESLISQADALQFDQSSLRGLTPGFRDIPKLMYLAQKFKTIPLPDPPTLDAFANIQELFEQNAEYAKKASLYRLAATWTMVGHGIASVVHRRAEEHRKRRVEEGRRISSGLDVIPKVITQDTSGQSPVPKPALRAVHGQAGDKAHSESNLESTSNLATPIARPVTHAHSTATTRQTLPDPEHDEAVVLPPAVAGPHQGESSKEISIRPSATADKLRPDFANPQWFSQVDLDERRALAGSYRVQPRAPLSLETYNARSMSIDGLPPLDRHNSDESFAMFSTSAESKQPSMPSSFASVKSQSQMESIPEDWSQPPPDTQSLVDTQSAGSESPMLTRRMSLGSSMDSVSSSYNV